MKNWIYYELRIFLWFDKISEKSNVLINHYSLKKNCGLIKEKLLENQGKFLNVEFFKVLLKRQCSEQFVFDTSYCESNHEIFSFCFNRWEHFFSNGLFLTSSICLAAEPMMRQHESCRWSVFLGRVRDHWASYLVSSFLLIGFCILWCSLSRFCLG